MRCYSIAFSGLIKSGKTSLSEAVAKRLNWPRVSFGDQVRSVAASRGLDANDRNVLRAIGESLVERSLRDFCTDVLAQSGTFWSPGRNILIDGVRHVEAIATLGILTSPSIVKLVYVETPEEMRRERLPENWSTVAEDRHSTEIQVGTLLRLRSDKIVDGSLDVEINADDVVDWIGGMQA